MCKYTQVALHLYTQLIRTQIISALFTIFNKLDYMTYEYVQLGKILKYVISVNNEHNFEICNTTTIPLPDTMITCIYILLITYH